MEEILLDTFKIEYKETEVFSIANDRQNTSSSSVRSKNISDTDWSLLDEKLMMKMN